MVTCVLAATGLLCWPSPARIRTRPPASMARAARHSVAGHRGSALLVNVLVAVCSCTAFGLAVGVSASLISATVTQLARSELRRRRDHRDLADLLVATRTLTRELRSGAAPAAAIAATAAAHPGMPAQVLEALITGPGGERRPGGAGHPTKWTLAAEMTERLALGQLMSGRHGVPWVALVETISTDLADRIQARSERSAQVAGPRVSGYVLAAMPGLGVLLGTGMGADPLHVLFDTGAGHLMMLVGCALTCAGLIWSARIVR